MTAQSEPSSEAITAALKFCDQFEQTTMGDVGCHTLKDPNDIRARFTVGSLARYVATALDEFASARVEAEREACARTCEAQRWFGARQNENLFDRTRDRMAEAIRSRSSQSKAVGDAE